MNGYFRKGAATPLYDYASPRRRVARTWAWTNVRPGRPPSSRRPVRTGACSRPSMRSPMRPAMSSRWRPGRRRSPAARRWPSSARTARSAWPAPMSRRRQLARRHRRDLRGLRVRPRGRLRRRLARGRPSLGRAAGRRRSHRRRARVRARRPGGSARGRRRARPVTRPEAGTRHQDRGRAGDAAALCRRGGAGAAHVPRRGPPGAQRACRLRRHSLRHRGVRRLPRADHRRLPVRAGADGRLHRLADRSHDRSGRRGDGGSGAADRRLLGRFLRHDLRRQAQRRARAAVPYLQGRPRARGRVHPPGPDGSRGRRRVARVRRARGLRLPAPYRALDRHGGARVPAPGPLRDRDPGARHGAAGRARLLRSGSSAACAASTWSASPPRAAR